MVRTHPKGGRYFCASGGTAGFRSYGLCAERAVGSDPFVVLLADDFLTDYEPGVTADLQMLLQKQTAQLKSCKSMS